jgi:hypothetical protein
MNGHQNARLTLRRPQELVRCARPIASAPLAASTPRVPDVVLERSYARTSVGAHTQSRRTTGTPPSNAQRLLLLNIPRAASLRGSAPDREDRACAAARLCHAARQASCCPDPRGNRHRADRSCGQTRSRVAPSVGRTAGTSLARTPWGFGCLAAGGLTHRLRVVFR